MYRFSILQGAWRRWMLMLPPLGALCALLPLLGLGQRRGGHDREVTNSTGMRLVRVPAGEFLMGGQEPAERLASDFREYGRAADYFADEYPRHRVRIRRPFFLGKFEVTVGRIASGQGTGRD